MTQIIAENTFNNLVKYGYNNLVYRDENFSFAYNKVDSFGSNKIMKAMVISIV